MNIEQKIAWITKYVERVVEDAKLEKRLENGRLRVNIEVYDLLEIWTYMVSYIIYKICD